jgi:hypothetical protein
MLFGLGGIMYIVGNDQFDLGAAMRRDPALATLLNAQRVDVAAMAATDAPNVELTTDDWPYLYVKQRGIPRMYLLIIVPLLLLLAVSLAGILRIKKREDVNLHFLFLGAAFMLLEFQNISKASLIFGSTWLVNSYMISAILLLILLANWVMKLGFVRNIKWVYYLLGIYLLVLYLVPLSAFNSFEYLTKSMLVSVFMNVPIFFAGLVFIHSFRECKDRKMAYASNLLGAALGGLLESCSFVTGIKALLLSVLLLYILSYFTRRGIAADLAT